VRESTVARSYAEALFELGERHNLVEAFAEAFEAFTRLLESEPSVRAFLETPKVEPAEKKRVLRESLEGRVPPLFMNFLLLMIDKRRQRMILPTAAEYRALLDERLNRVHAQVTLAREPDEQTEREIAGQLSRVLGRTVIPHIKVDPKILGGIVVRYGDHILDGSLRRKLTSLRRRLLEAEVPAAT